MSSRESLRTWWRALRAYSFAATVAPVACAGLAARAHGYAVEWGPWLLMTLCAVLLHAGVNLLNDYYDFVLGFDSEKAVGSSGVLTGGLRPPAYMRRWGHVYLGCGIACGLALAAARGWLLLPMGAAGAAGAFFYSHRRGYKYAGWGEPMVFVLMGPLLFVAAHFAASGAVTIRAAALSLPFGCLVSAILLANNIRDLEMDTAAGLRTLPARIGAARAQWLYAGLIAAAFAAPPVFAAAALLPPAALLCLLTLPLGWRAARRVLRARPPYDSLARAPEETARLYLVYGVLFAAGLLAAALRPR